MSHITPTLAKQAVQSPRRVASARSFHSTDSLRTPAPPRSPTKPAGTRERKPVLPEFDLRGRVIVVSGGARGLGLVQTEALLEAGATVHSIDRMPSPGEDPSSDFSEVSRRAREELNTSLTYHECDVRNVKALNDIMEEIANKDGRLDGLLAAAGINIETPALEHTAEDVDKLMSINVTGCFMTAQAVARQMVRLKQKGSICMIASMSGTVANRGMSAAAYNASKGAVVQLCRSLAAEWGPLGIRVNTISPGYIETKMLTQLFEDFPERKVDYPKGNMLNRLSDPHEYRGAAVFALSDASTFMTGSDIHIDGGHTAW